MKVQRLVHWSGFIAWCWCAIGMLATWSLSTGLVLDGETMSGVWFSRVLGVVVVGLPVFLAMVSLRSRSVIGKVFGATFLSYFGVYVGLSLMGTFQPLIVGPSTVKSYAWAPYGFYDALHPWPRSRAARLNPIAQTGGWNDTLKWTFLPLWYFDIHAVHVDPF